MKQAWIVLLVSAFTDFIINAGTALTSAMVATGNAAMPSKAVVILALIGGLVAFSRTVQQALKATPETTAALKGTPSISTTTTVTSEKTP